jgi:hypothetical protein
MSYLLTDSLSKLGYYLSTQYKRHLSNRIVHCLYTVDILPGRL